MIQGADRGRISLWLLVATAIVINAPLVGATVPARVSSITVSPPIATRMAIEPATDGTSEFVGTWPFPPGEILQSQAATLSAQGTVRVAVRVGSTPFGFTLVRVAGPNRYDTAIQVSQREFGSAPVVVLATGENWPDALGGSSLAGACNGPLLLTQRAALPASVRAEIARLGAGRVYLLGGTAAVGPAVESALVSMLGRANVTRLGGSDRYGTARLVADETIRVLGGGYSGSALVATGVNFPDATAGAAVAAALGRPILLARPGSTDVYLPPATRRVLILGGPAAVSGATERALASRLGGAVGRAGGANRYATAVLIAQAGVAAGMSWDGMGLATGVAFPDALSGGAMVGAHNSVLLLTQPSTLTGETRAVLAQHRESIHTLYLFGSTRAVTGGVEDAVRAAVAGS